MRSKSCAWGTWCPTPNMRIADDARAGAARRHGGAHLDSRRQRHARLLRRPGGHRRRHRRRRLVGHGGSGRDARGGPLHRGPRQGNHFRQRAELLSLRFGKHRTARARTGFEQGGGRRRLEARLARRGAGGVRATSQRHGGVPADRQCGQPADQRTHGSRGRAGHPDQAHSENHQRQSATAFARGGVRRRASSTRNSQSSRRCARRGAARSAKPARDWKRACNRFARRRCPARESR